LSVCGCQAGGGVQSRWTTPIGPTTTRFTPGKQVLRAWMGSWPACNTYRQHMMPASGATATPDVPLPFAAPSRNYQETRSTVCQMLTQNTLRAANARELLPGLWLQRSWRRLAPCPDLPLLNPRSHQFACHRRARALAAPHRMRPGPVECRGAMKTARRRGGGTRASRTTAGHRSFRRWPPQAPTGASRLPRCHS